MSISRAVLCWCLLLTVPSALCVAAEWQSPLLQTHPLVGQIVERQSGQVIAYRELIARLEQYPMILIGEKHDNPDHHRFESRLLESLVTAQTAVAFEMLDDGYTPALEALPDDLSLAELKTALRWPEHGWSWDDYGPLLSQVLQQGGQIKSANIDRSQMMAIYREGSSALSDQRRFASVARVGDDLQKPIMNLVFESHCGKMAKEKLQPMVDIQLAKDASMAAALAGQGDTVKPLRSILITGGIHARKDVGVPRHLPAKTRAVTLLMIEVDEQRTEAGEYPAIQQNQADYVWFSPMFTDEDYCSRLSE
ncbi:ChaN family lipoprotein [Aestuariicella sp. G3-2]|uniref:ChaN family lipoprotein n=1 Tax=Pseudomaricurvus albidus TaxID=2842452 RepID=UPI001C0D04DD|nr:ChaN family lipoprotein [Aestuariicella albida]MBU3068918.1 ChaN family lipoprotein [Aestuariicella albida]